MEIRKDVEKRAYAVKCTAVENGQTVGRAYLYIIFNDLHEEPYGLLEDVFVNGESRGKGLGGQLVREVIEEAKARGCHKLICTSRHGKEELHEWYKSFGFRDHGAEFRMDF